MKNLSGTIKATVTHSKGDNYDFPEQTADFLKASSNSAICFSGGGNRSLSACMGQMRGLKALGILENARYISCVSGGSWAAAAYTYYKEGPANDDELLGNDPDSSIRKSRHLAAWGESLQKFNLGFPSTVNFRTVLEKYILKEADNLAWIDTVREVFFKPYGLDDNHFIADSAASVKEILQKNAHLQPDWHDAMFTVPREGRPYLIINGTLLWSVGLDDMTKRVLLQFTPAYVGNPFALTLTESHLFFFKKRFDTGGGVVDNFAFQSSGPNQVATTWQEMPAPKTPFSLWHASGISSAAYGYKASKGVGEILGQHFIPKIKYWAASDAKDSHKKAKKHYVTDAGNLENLGIMAPLQRQVEYITVFVNTPTPIKQDSQGNITIDKDVSALFGVNNEEFSNNQVFAPSDYPKLLQDLWVAYEQGDLCMAKGRYTTQKNDWFGIPSYTVNVLWVYNAAIKNWATLLDSEVQKEVIKGIKGEGSLACFPNYKTLGENASKPADNIVDKLINKLGKETKNHISIYQTPTQTALIADMFSWGIQQQQQAETFRTFLAPVTGSNKPKKS